MWSDSKLETPDPRPETRAGQKTGPEYIDEIAGGYRAAQILFAANRLGLFQQLGHESLSADELAAALESDPRGTRIICDALTALSVLEKRQGRYQNSQMAREFLLPGTPPSKVAQLHHGAKLYERWGTLYDAVKTGQPADDDAIDPRLVGDKRSFAEAMADTARAVANRTAVRVDLAGRRKMLDIGGGPGLYSIAFAHRYPQLKVVILDNDETIEVARENIEEAGLSDRISTLAGDAFEDDLGSGYDFVFLSNLVHIYSGEENRKLIARCSAAMIPGGLLCLKDFFLEKDRTSPVWSALFAVNMLVNTEAGDCYTLGEVDGWFQEAGLEFLKRLELTPQSQLVLARRV